MGFIDLFKGFHCEAIQQEFTPSARVLYDTLLFKFNEEYWVDSLAFSERDLIQLTGLKKTTLHEAKHFLTSKHIIKCTPFKKKTAYSLDGELKKIQATSSRPVGDQSGAAPYIRVREDVKTEDIKTKKNNNSAGACENLDEVLDYWEELCGSRLTFEHQSQLSVWVNQKGVEWVKEVMQTAADSNNNPRGISFNYLKAIVQNKLNAQPSAQKPAKTSVADMLKALDEQIKW